MPVAAETLTTVVVVRHAEKATDQGKDPHLTDAGRETRAALLASLVKTQPVGGLYTSEFHRTRETLVPLSEQSGVEIVTVPARETAETLTAKRLIEDHPGQLVVIASHSNLTPEIVEALTGDVAPTIDDSTYDDLFVVTIHTGRLGAFSSPEVRRTTRLRPAPPVRSARPGTPVPRQHGSQDHRQQRPGMEVVEAGVKGRDRSAPRHRGRPVVAAARMVGIMYGRRNGNVHTVTSSRLERPIGADTVALPQSPGQRADSENRHYGMCRQQNRRRDRGEDRPLGTADRPAPAGPSSRPTVRPGHCLRYRPPGRRAAG